MASVTEPKILPLDDDPAPKRPFLFEVVDGQIVKCRPMGAYETEIASILEQLLGPYIRDNRLGRVVTEMLFCLDEATKLSRRPDVAFVSAERWPIGRRVPRKNAWTVVPDLAIEIVSPTNTAEEVTSKIRDYFAYGVRLAWVIYPGSEAAHVYSSPRAAAILTRDEALDGGDVVPGFRLPLADLFAGDDGEDEAS